MLTIARKNGFAIAAAISVAVLAVVPTALAGKGGGKPGGGGGGTCVRNAPSVSVDNNWSWSGDGTYGLPGQRITYAIHVTNNDKGCGSSSFAVNVTSDSGFSVSVPTSTISLGSPASGYLFAYVTSPSGTADGDYPVAVNLQRAGATVGSFTSWYKVYSSDTAAPTLYWPAPDAGAAITGRSYNVGIQANDDHSVQKLEIYIDGVLRLSRACDDISYNCQAVYTWSTKAGSHTATFKGYDWMGNVAVQTVNFTVG